MPDCAFYWNAFALLHSRREATFSAQPIPLVEIQAYLDIRRITEPFEREGLMDVVVWLDNQWLEDQRKQAETKGRRRGGDRVGRGPSAKPAKRPARARARSAPHKQLTAR